MSDRINIAEHREAARQGDYFLNAETMLALLDVAEAAREVVQDGISRTALAGLAAALERVDFGDA